MQLFEITNGFQAASYVRCYVWATSGTSAAELFNAKYPEQRIAGMIVLMDSDAGPFCTDLSGDGWEPSDFSEHRG